VQNPISSRFFDLFIDFKLATSRHQCLELEPRRDIFYWFISNFIIISRFFPRWADPIKRFVGFHNFIQSVLSFMLAKLFYTIKAKFLIWHLWFWVSFIPTGFLARWAFLELKLNT
jgi:hypothetical protein